MKFLMNPNFSWKIILNECQTMCKKASKAWKLNNQLGFHQSIFLKLFLVPSISPKRDMGCNQSSHTLFSLPFFTSSTKTFNSLHLFHCTVGNQILIKILKPPTPLAYTHSIPTLNFSHHSNTFTLNFLCSSPYQILRTLVKLRLKF